MNIVANEVLKIAENAFRKHVYSNLEYTFPLLFYWEDLISRRIKLKFLDVWKCLSPWTAASDPTCCSNT
jgi:hypothetical protein